MGCFNLKGFLSGISILEGDDIVMFLVKRRKAAEGCYPCSTVAPLTFPIFGKYDDYGGITDIKMDANAKWLEKNIGPIEHIVRAACECMDEFYPTIKDCLESDNEFHPETEIRYVYTKLLELGLGLSKEDSIGVIFEHKEIYDGCKSVYYRSVSIEEAINGEPRFCFSSSLMSKIHDYNHFSNSDEYDLFEIYWKDDTFLKKNIKSLKRMEQLLDWMQENGKGFTFPTGCYSQDDFYNEDIKFHERCIKLIKTKKKEHGWENEE